MQNSYPQRITSSKADIMARNQTSINHTTTHSTKPNTLTNKSHVLIHQPNTNQATRSRGKQPVSWCVCSSTGNLTSPRVFGARPRKSAFPRDRQETAKTDLWGCLLCRHWLARHLTTQLLTWTARSELALASSWRRLVVVVRSIAYVHWHSDVCNRATLVRCVRSDGEIENLAPCAAQRHRCCRRPSDFFFCSDAGTTRAAQ